MKKADIDKIRKYGRRTILETVRDDENPDIRYQVVQYTFPLFHSSDALAIEFDNTWLCLNGQIVPYYFIGHVEDGKNWADVGRVPVLINGVRYDLIIVFDNETEENEYGYVAGAQRVYDNGETENVSKGFTPLKTGDKIEFICDYYGADGTFEASYKIGQLTVNGALAVGYIELENEECDVTYCLTDIYRNEFWTEAVTFR